MFGRLVFELNNFATDLLNFVNSLQVGQIDDGLGLRTECFRASHMTLFRGIW